MPVLVNGKAIEIPDTLSFDMNEGQTVYDLYGVDIFEIGAGGDKEPSKIAVARALLHIGIQRSDGTLTVDEIRDAVGKVKLADLLEGIADREGEGEGDPVPLAPSESSSSNGGSSADGSATSSESPGEDAPETSGIPGSAISG